MPADAAPLLLPAAAAAIAVALALRPWRAVGAGGPPWPWVAAWALLPLLWTLDRLTAVPLVPVLSGAPMLVLLAGWPLAVLAMAGAAALAMPLAGLDALEALQRYVGLGVLPATVALVLGAALRRWAPPHLFVYILGRGFIATLLAAALAGALTGDALPAASLAPGERLVARLLAAFGEAFISGGLTAILVAYRPQWLATYADRLYLPRG